MSLWFEIVITCVTPLVFIFMLKIIGLLKSILNFNEAHYNTTKTFTKWVVMGGMVDLVRNGINGIREFREKKKNDKND